MSEAGAARLAAGKMRRILLPGEAELIQELAGKVDVVARPEAGFNIGKRRSKAGKIRLLRQITHHGPRLHENGAAVRLDVSGRDLQQGRFARSVAPHKRNPLAGGDGEFHAGQQRCAAEGQCDVFELKEGRSHVGPSHICIFGLLPPGPGFGAT